MTPELEQRLESFKSPFDGICIHNSNTLELATLRELLSSAMSILSTDYPTINSFRDWHEHDGFIVDSVAYSWDTLSKAIKTDRALFESRDDDFGVRVAFCPSTINWLLRYNIDQSDENDYTTATCDFDLTICKGSELSDRVGKLLRSNEGILVQSQSQTWFQSNYGG